jgi:hypothetical protein
MSLELPDDHEDEQLACGLSSSWTVSLPFLLASAVLKRWRAIVIHPPIYIDFVSVDGFLVGLG